MQKGVQKDVQEDLNPRLIGIHFDLPGGQRWHIGMLLVPPYDRKTFAFALWAPVSSVLKFH